MVGPATGGMGAHVAGLAAGLAAEGLSVTVFTSPATAQRFAIGVPARVVTRWSSGPRGALRTLLALRRSLAGVDLVHAHGHQAGLLSVLAARTRRRRPAVVVSWHNAVLVGGLKARLLAVAETIQARGADLVTGASEDLVVRAGQLGARAAELAEVAAPAASVAPAVASDADGSDSVEKTRPVVLTVSRIAPQKRLDLVVEAAAQLAGTVPGALWQVVGDGDPQLLSRLQQLARDRRAPVEFLGARTDVPALMRAADVLALASTWEARALVVQEAMAAGLPVVVPAVGGLPGLLAGAGLLVAPGDAAALAEAVATVATQPGRAAAMAQAGLDRFAQLPTESGVVHLWAVRYRAITQRD